jgi:hypothetical protein
MMGTGYLDSRMWTLILLLGLTSAQQQQLLSNEVGVENAGYAVDPNDQNNYYASQYANSAPGTEFYSQYPQEAVQAASDTDRITPELVDGAVSPVIMGVAFASAVLGSLLAPLIQALMNVVADVRVPDIFSEIDLPRLKRRRKDDNYKKDRTLESSSLLDSALDKIVESIEDEYEY